MAVYALEIKKSGRQKLVEFPSRQHADGAYLAGAQGMLDGMTYKICGAAEARKWVKEGGQHETALYVNQDGKVRRAN